VNPLVQVQRMRITVRVRRLGSGLGFVSCV